MHKRDSSDSLFDSPLSTWCCSPTRSHEKQIPQHCWRPVDAVGTAGLHHRSPLSASELRTTASGVPHQTDLDLWSGEVTGVTALVLEGSETPGREHNEQASSVSPDDLSGSVVVTS